jgi:DEAD/DEAH box helicase domain-containing protein
VSVFVATASPIDQFIMNDTEWFFRKSAEEGRVDPENPYILTDHVKCACFELPFRDGELGTGEWDYPERIFTTEYTEFHEEIKHPQSPIQDALEYLEEAGIVRHAGEKWHWADRSFPAEGISIRSATADNVVIIDVTVGRNMVIGEMDRPSAKELIFDNAVYLHRGRQYLVEKLDIENRTALVREAEVNYFTDGLVKTDIKVLTEDERWRIVTGEQDCPERIFTTEYTEFHGEKCENHIKAPCSSVVNLLSSPYSLQAVLSDVLVRSQTAKFKKIRFHTHENIGYGDIDLPEEEMQTRALALLFDPQSAGGKALAEMNEAEIGAALSGAGTLIRTIAPVFLLCDPRDLGIAERVRDPICVNLRRIKNTKLRYPLAFRVSAKIRQAGEVFFQTFGF